jgi:hypothetical protein
MSTVAEIESAIEKLSAEEQKKLEAWFLKREQSKPSIFEKLRALAGTATHLPADLSVNHDHYLHGKTKRSDS